MPNTKDISTENVFRRFLILGAPGTGKTTFASTFPKPYFFDFDNKMLVLAGKDIDYDTYADTGTTPKAWRAFIDKLENLLKNPVAEYQTIVLDSFTMLQEIGMNEVQRVNATYGKPVQLKEWGILSGMLNDVLYMLKAVTTMHVVVVVHEEIIKDDESRALSIVPMAMGKLSSYISAFFHEVYRTKTRRTSKGIEYYIVTKAIDGAPGTTTLKGLSTEEKPDFNHLMAKDKEWHNQNKQ